MVIMSAASAPQVDAAPAGGHLGTVPEAPEPGGLTAGRNLMADISGCAGMVVMGAALAPGGGRQTQYD